ncbi:MAG: universal stress protein [Proteobacteria bacterium]|nr:universal stress protein [Pseudomonadota bacterium]
MLLATDGSEFASAPTEIAIALAKSFGVTLDILTVADPAEDDEVARQRIAGAARNALVAGVDSEEIVRRGKHRVAAIIEAAAEANTNILVIGRQPARDLKHRLLGDVASSTIVQAPCHVLVVGPQTGMWHKRIVIVSDASECSDHAAELASQIARITQTPITVVAFAEGKKAAAASEEDVARKAALMKLDGVVADTRVIDGVAGSALLETVRELGADLVVVGAQRSHMINRTFPGSTADDVIGGLHCAVLVVKAGGANAIVSGLSNGN